MSILGTDAFRMALERALVSATSSVSIITAYSTMEGIEWVLDKLPNHIKDFKFLVRWELSDLLSGASNIGIFEVLSQRQFRLWMKPDLHAKAVLVDNTALLLGSANITTAGLKLAPGGNRELGIQVCATREDVRTIDALFEESIEVTADLYKSLTESLDVARRVNIPSKSVQWPDEVQKLLEKVPHRLWVAEFPWTKTPAELFSEIVEPRNANHDRALLGLNEISPSFNTLRKSFLRSRAYQFVRSNLSSINDQQIYFGEFALLIERQLMDDPLPYRKEIKDLASSMLEWISSLAGHEIIVDRPNHSQRMRLLSKQNESTIDAELAYKISSLHVDRGSEWDVRTKYIAPHKPILLLAVIKQISLNRIEDNRIYPTIDLEREFLAFWKTIFGSMRDTTFALPFYHLQTDTMWKLCSPITEEIPENSRKSAKILRDYQIYAWMDDALFQRFKNHKFRMICLEKILNNNFSQDIASSIASLIKSDF